MEICHRDGVHGRSNEEPPPLTAEVRGIVGNLQENIKKLSEDERNKEANMEELENHMGCLAANLTRRGKGSWGW